MTFLKPDAYVILPWTVSPPLPDHLRCTYELLISLAYSRDRRRTPPITRRELAAWRGLAVRTIDEHLAALRQRGLIRNDPTFEGACLVLELLQAEDVPQRPGEEPAAELTSPAPQADPAHGHDATNAAPVATERAASQPLRPQPLRPAADPEEEASTMISDDQHLLTAQALLEAGVYHGVAQKLAHLPWVTPDLVRRWSAMLAQQRHVRHLGAVLATTLGDPQRCFPAPELPPAPEPPSPAAVERVAPAPQRPPPKIDIDWPAVLTRLQASLGDQAVKLWFGRAQPVSQGQNGLVVAMGSPQALDWVTARYLPELREALNSVAGRRLQVHLVLRG